MPVARVMRVSNARSVGDDRASAQERAELGSGGGWLTWAMTGAGSTGIIPGFEPDPRQSVFQPSIVLPSAPGIR